MAALPGQIVSRSNNSEPNNRGRVRSKTMKKQRRWMTSVIEASKSPVAPLPFQRGYRKVKVATPVSAKRAS